MSESLGRVMRDASVVDLTYTLTPDFPLFPVYDPIDVRDRFNCADHGFYVRGWSFDEHCGTHVDAPAHFSPDAATVDQIPPAQLVLEAAVIDVRDRVAHDDDALVLPDDVLAWERRHGELPEHCAVLALTGWGSRAGDPQAFLNKDGEGVLHTPGFSGEVADFLKAERPQVQAIGIDTASLDIGASGDFPAHVSWLPSGRFGIENLAQLEQVPEAGAMVVVGAPKFAQGSGGPARVLALLP
jgi:kynurenine formamidase